MQPIESLIKKLHHTVRFDLRHKHYDRTVELAEFYKQIITGQGQEDLIENYKERETEAQKKNRIKVTKTLTKYASQQIIKFFKKLRRVDNVRYEIEAKDIDLLDKKLKKWKNGTDHIDFTFDTLEYYGFIDPNALLVIDLKVLRDVQNVVIDITPYPIVFNAKSVINLQKENGNLEWIIVCQEEMELLEEKGMIVTNPINHYYLFTTGYSVELIEYNKKEPDRKGEKITLEHAGGKKKTYLQIINNTGSQETPFVELGAYLDYATNNELYVSPLESAREVFTDLINLKSEFDITKYLHAFPQKIAFAPPCQHIDKEYGGCNCGTLARPDNNGNDVICPSCHGSGVDVHTSAQDVILVRLPEDKQQWIPLQDLVAYVQLPEWLPKWQHEMIEVLLKRVSIAIFNIEVFATPQFEQTATASLIEYDKVYDTLTPYANRVSRIIEKIVRLSAQYLEVELVQIQHKFPKDFKLRSLSELMQLFKTAKESGASYTILWAIQCDILAKLYANDTAQVEKVKAEQAFKPFQDKTTEETTFILSSRSKTDFDRVLWENFDSIFKEIHQEIAQTEAMYLHLMPYEAQRNTLLQKIEEYIERIEYTASIGTLPVGSDLTFNEEE